MKQCMGNDEQCGSATWKVSNDAGDVKYACGHHLGRACAAVTLWVRPTHERAIVELYPKR